MNGLDFLANCYSKMLCQGRETLLASLTVILSKPLLQTQLIFCIKVCREAWWDLKNWKSSGHATWLPHYHSACDVYRMYRRSIRCLCYQPIGFRSSIRKITESKSVQIMFRMAEWYMNRNGTPTSLTISFMILLKEIVATAWGADSWNTTSSITSLLFNVTCWYHIIINIISISIFITLSCMHVTSQNQTSENPPFCIFSHCFWCMPWAAPEDVWVALLHSELMSLHPAQALNMFFASICNHGVWIFFDTMSNQTYCIYTLYITYM